MLQALVSEESMLRMMASLCVLAMHECMFRGAHLQLVSRTSSLITLPCKMMRAEKRLLEAMDRIYNCIPRIVEVQKKRIKENLFDHEKVHGENKHHCREDKS